MSLWSIFPSSALDSDLLVSRDFSLGSLLVPVGGGEDAERDSVRAGGQLLLSVALSRARRLTEHGRRNPAWRFAHLLSLPNPQKRWKVDKHSGLVWRYLRGRVKLGEAMPAQTALVRGLSEWWGETKRLLSEREDRGTGRVFRSFNQVPNSANAAQQRP